MFEFYIGDIVKQKHSDVHGVIIAYNHNSYKVFWFDEDTQKENYNHSYPAFYMVKVKSNEKE